MLRLFEKLTVVIPWLLLISIEIPIAKAEGQNRPYWPWRPTNQTGPSRLVFAHFIMGTVGNRDGPSDYDADMQLAKGAGIDAFALNIGTDSYTDTQLGYAYASAASNNMKVFISFDFNFWSTASGSDVGAKIAQYANQSSQLIVDGKVFASSFVGDAVDVGAVRAAANTPIFFAPNFSPARGTDSFAALDAAFNWLAWPNNGANKAPTPSANVSVSAGDQAYLAALQGKPYVAPVSPWFFTHYGAEVSYSKNWVFPGELLWVQRWTELLNLGPRFVEIITWNDYGESHYIGPLSSPHNDDGNSKWTINMPHDGWLKLATPFIAAYRAGDRSPNRYITEDQIIYWYRPNPLSLDCDATDTTMLPANNASGDYFNGKPNGWQDLSDSIFVTALLTSYGRITVTSGNSTQSFRGNPGVNVYQVPMGVGQQSFALERRGKTTLSATSKRDVTETCGCGNYNFNAYVGTVPESPPDNLLPEGYSALTNGIRVPVDQCSATQLESNLTAAVNNTAASNATVKRSFGWKNYLEIFF